MQPPHTPAIMAHRVADEVAGLALSSSTPEQQKNTALPTPPKNTISTHRALGTAELLEMILLNLDMRTLLLSQRVNRFFQGVIAGSTKLQQALFFKLDPNSSLEGQPPGYDIRQCKLNPLLATEACTNWLECMSSPCPDFLLKCIDIRPSVDEAGETSYSLAAPSEGDLGRVSLYADTVREGHARWGLIITATSPDWALPSEPRPDMERQRYWQDGASWKRMYLCTSPHLVGWSTFMYSYPDVVEARAQKPVTLGELLQLKGRKVRADGDGW